MKTNRTAARWHGSGVCFLLGMMMAWASQVQAQPAAAAPAAGAAAAAPEAKKSAWERSASLGATYTTGNSDSILFTGTVLGTKKWDQNEWALGSDGSYGKTEGVQNAESIRGFSQYNRLFTERVFGYMRVEALHDGVADVNYRLTIGPGVGYYFIKDDRALLRGEVGPSYVFEKQGGEEDDYLTARVAERFEYKLSERSKLWQSLEWLPQVDDWENYILNAEIGVETELTKLLNLRVYLQDTYDNQPAPDRRENDLKMVTALAIKF